MAISLNHVHIKTADPRKTAQWYVDHVGAKIVRENSRDGAVTSLRLDIHGIPVNVTGIIGTQDPKRQHFGFEHFALDTTTYDDDCAKLKADGVKLLEEQKSATSGLRTVWWEGPDGVQIELLEQAPKP